VTGEPASLDRRLFRLQLQGCNRSDWAAASKGNKREGIIRAISNGGLLRLAALRAEYSYIAKDCVMVMCFVGNQWLRVGSGGL
jgi:hypothetical protein